MSLAVIFMILSELCHIKIFMKRLFFALWPDNAIRKQINGLNQSITSADLNKVYLDNLHVTLVFLGQVDSKSEAKIIACTDNISQPAFSLHFEQLVFWKKPRILCLTTQQYDPQLLILLNALKNIVRQCGVQTEDRPYRPHITLARKATQNISRKIGPIKWQAQSFCLLQSCSTPSGVKYQVLQRWDLN